MNSIDIRRQKVNDLYALRAKIANEIAGIEAQIDEEIRAMRRASEAARKQRVKVARRPRAECGTDGGYYRHRRTLKEPACEACKLAHRVAERERAERRAVA